MKLIYKVYICILIFVIVLGISISACAADKVEIKFLHRWTQEPYSTFFNEVAADFEKLNPDITVDVQAISNDPFKEKIKIVLGSDQAPDVFFTWPGEFTNRFIRAGQIYDLTSEMGQNGWKDTFVYSQLEPFVYNGKIYGTPYRLDGKVFVYNTKIFKEVGVEVPENYKELVNVCKEIKDAGITPIGFGNIADWAVSHYIGTLNQKCVPDEVRLKDIEPDKGEFTHPGYVQALEKYVELVPYFNKNSNAINHDEARAALFTGTVAMMYLEIVEIPEIESSAPEEFKNNYSVFPLPPVVGGLGDQSYLTGYPEGFVVSANTKYPKEAVAFLKYLTGKEVGKKEAKELGFINGIKNVVEKGEVIDSIYDTTQIVLNTEQMVNWLDSSLHAKIWSIYGPELQKLTDGSTTPEKAMENVRKAAEKVRSEF